MSFRLKMILPVLLAAALLALSGLLPMYGVVVPWWYWGSAAVLIVIAALFAIEWCAVRPLRLFAEYVYALAHGTNAKVPRMDTTLGVIQRAVDALVASLQRDDAVLANERALRERAQMALREAEERYSLALRCTNDGLWEWDLKSDRVHYSPTWKAALGYTDEAIGDTLLEWHDRIHPDDRAAVLQQFNAHLRGDCVALECDHRLRHRDGSYRWFLIRARAVHNASGKPYKVIGLNSEIGTRKRAEEILYGISNGLIAARGDDFFKIIVKNFAETLRVQYAFITQCVDRPPTRVRMIAAWKDGAYDELLEYELAGTPCDITIGDNQLTLIPCAVAERFSAEAGYESYLGIPICDSLGNVLGHLACLDAKPMDTGLPTLPIFTLFALRAGVEMERQMLLQKISSVN